MKIMEGLIFLAAAFDEEVKDATRSSNLDTRAVLIGLTILLAIAFALFAWVYFRSRKKSDVQDQERLSQFAQSLEKPKRPEPADGRKRRRKRRLRRDHRPRNASLSQTGGLPPPRPDDQLPNY